MSALARSLLLLMMTMSFKILFKRKCRIIANIASNKVSFLLIMSTKLHIGWVLKVDIAGRVNVSHLSRACISAVCRYRFTISFSIKIYKCTRFGCFKKMRYFYLASQLNISIIIIVSAKVHRSLRNVSKYLGWF